MTDRPRLSVVGLVYDDEGRILMGRRRRGPSKGKLVMPGGGVEMGETIAQALKREVFEETNLKVTADTESSPIDVAEMPSKKAHRVCLIYPATVDPRQVKPMGDTDELYGVGFYPTDALNMQDWVRASLKRIGIID